MWALPTPSSNLGLSANFNRKGIKMPYDSNLDECLFSKSWEGENERITVGVYSYNKGQKKLQITRENRGNDGDFRFAKLGRVTKEELESLLPLLQEAVKSM